MLTIDLPAILRPVNLTPNGDNIRSVEDWERAARNNGGTLGRKMAKRNARENGGPAVMFWNSGRMTIYAISKTHGDMVRIRYAGPEGAAG